MFPALFRHHSALTTLFAAVVLTGCESEPEAQRVPGTEVPSRLPAADQQAKAPTAASLASYVEALARSNARKDYAAPAVVTPGAFADLDYDGYRSIRFRPEAALWRDQSAFEIQLFHPGFIFEETVQVHLVNGDEVTNVPYDASFFSFDGSVSELASDTALMNPGLGYAGFRVHYPLNRADRLDEVAVFQGASYFRLVGRDQVFGLSPRGLAVDIAREGGEEFPRFSEFWLVKPAPADTSLALYALLDGPSVTGSYRFELFPGGSTELAVDAHIFARRDIGTLGVAPLSSMFLYGSNHVGRHDDVRPQVHDSDGLMMLTRVGEWIWRPLGNGAGLRVTSLRDIGPQGFGLIQRERDFGQYLDVEAHYHRRPSVWVSVQEGDWGEGGVELLEIPTDSEFNDNIAAYWVPDGGMTAGEERHYRYTLSTFDGRLAAQTLGQVARTRVGWAGLPGQAEPPPRSERRFLVDFEGGALDGVGSDERVEAGLQSSAGSVSDVRTQPLPGGGWRASFRLDPDGNRPADMRLVLTHDGEALTETWSYVWYPEQIQEPR